MPHRIAITGAAGRIGSAVARRLATDGHELVLLDRRRADVEMPGTFIETDLRNRERIVNEIAGVTIVLHLGEIPHTGIGWSDEELFASNTAACRSLLDAALAVGARRFVYTSSCQAYGYWGDAYFDKTRTPARWPLDEFQPLSPRNAYAHSKAANELACRETSARTKLETFIFRFPWVVPTAHASASNRKPAKADGSNVDGFWTYLAMDDAVDAYALACDFDRPTERLPSACEGVSLRRRRCLHRDAERSEPEEIPARFRSAADGLAGVFPARFVRKGRSIPWLGTVPPALRSGLSGGFLCPL